jgi:hypothetical protein
VYKVVVLQLHCSSQLIQQLPSSPIATSILINITAFLRKAKAALLEHMKTLPDVHIVAKEDFIAWG